MKTVLIRSIFILFSVFGLVGLTTNAYFSAQEYLSNNTFNTTVWSTQQSLVINEVYYRPDDKTVGDSKEKDPDDEWIEIYNASASPINLKDWYLVDNGGINRKEVISQDYVIQPAQFVLVAANASVWSFWPNIPSEATKIALGKSRMFSFGLRNDGDRVELYDNTGRLIDAVSWGDDTSAFEPSVPSVSKGHSIERSPRGRDSNTSSDFIDQMNPTPGEGI